jgi:hypothetical protein
MRSRPPKEPGGPCPFPALAVVAIGAVFSGEPLAAAGTVLLDAGGAPGPVHAVASESV